MRKIDFAENNTKDLYTSAFEYLEPWKRAELCGQIIALIFGIFGNSMIVFITTNNKKLHSTRGCLICSLAISHLLFSLSLVCLFVMLLGPDKNNGRFFVLLYFWIGSSVFDAVFFSTIESCVRKIFMQISKSGEFQA